MHDAFYDVLIKTAPFVVSQVYQDWWWEMHIRWSMFLEEKHGLDMSGVTHSDSSICVVGVQQEIGR